MYVIKEHCEDWVNRLNLRLKDIEIEREILNEEKRHIFLEREKVEQLIDILRGQEVEN